MRDLRDAYRTDARVVAARGALAGDRDLVIGACHGGLIPVLIAAMVEGPGPRPVVVCGEPQILVDDLEELGVVAAHLPQLDRFADEDGESERGQDRAGHNRRMAALEGFATGAVLVADAVAVEQPVPDMADVVGSSIVVKPGEERVIQQLVEQLIEAGYRVVGAVEGRGELAVRGGIIDAFPWIGNDPIRIEFFGDTVDTIRRFDAFTQESIARIDEGVLASSKGGLATKRLWDQLPPAPIVVLGDLPLRGRLKRDHGRREVRFARQLEQGAIDGSSLGIERLRGDLRRGLADLKRIVAEIATAGTAAGAAAGGVLLLARNDEAKRELEAHAADAGLTVDVRVGRLSAGFRDLDQGRTVVHDFELAEREPVRRRTDRVAGGAPLSSLSDLKRGDLVVHLKHGIGRFRGMATLEKRGFLEDFLLLEFAGDAKLYVPVDAIDLVQKYVGASGRPPDLSLIGGPAWAKKRARAEKAIADLSAELLQAQVQRIAAGGIVLPPDTPAVRRFEAAFPFEETEDQLAAVREIKADLERPVAMDRLLCGDVGFGKTEVAMRAAFKVAHAGWQVAVLAPTTLLAEQHLETFTERMAGTGVRIAGLNRFHSAKERHQVLAEASAGTLDILIGTHAILTDKLSFAKLGLLVVDEEHRFGVKQKEKLRALAKRLPPPLPQSGVRGLESGVDGSADATALPRSGVRSLESGVEGSADADPRPQTPDPGPGAMNAIAPDVLTLSATPIPRTLHFSLLGLRDISVLAEAPAQRMAIETRVAPWDDELVAHALGRELERKGQAFIVHNRVEDLDRIAHTVSRLVPGLRLDTIHGQMDEERIAKVMDAFRHHRIDCLVTTSIIESGIDIPNANTLFVSNAHCFGLAELHQIRGRIGRFTRQAYAYFLTPRNRELNEEARERLDAIQEYAELGAGFMLAMRDLELRGAGNLLGAEQTGHIDAIGYELYTKLVGEAVARAKAAASESGVRGLGSGVETAQGQRASAAAATASGESILSLPVDAYIPDTWLETPALKFELHKNLDRCRRLTDLATIARTARDRYGALADPVVRLFQVRAIRLRCHELGITRVDVQDRQFRLVLARALPKELAAVKLPELVHVQLDGTVLVLFMRPQLIQDVALGLLCRLLGLDLGFLGRGF